jgi:putative transcriptional regulator
MGSDMEKFQKDLLESVQQMKSGHATRATEVELSPVAAARVHVGMSQREFAGLLGVSPRKLQDWEQGRRVPTGAAKTLLQVAVKHPEVLRELLH